MSGGGVSHPGSYVGVGYESLPFLMIAVPWPPGLDDLAKGLGGVRGRTMMGESGISCLTWSLLDVDGMVDSLLVILLAGVM